MIYIHIFALFCILLTGICFLGIGSKKANLPKYSIAALLFCALLLRTNIASLSQGFGSDTACFAAWAERIFQVGPAKFYSPDVFTDYPPGYMYVLWVIGALRSLLNLEYYSAAHLLMLKLPAIICDLLSGLIIYKEASKKCADSQAFFLTFGYLFNPVIILNSSVWGQVDSIFTLTIVLMCLYLMRGKMYSAYIAFAVGLLIKPQALLFSPVLLAGIIDHVFLKDFSIKKFLHNLFQGLSAIAGLVILCLPFGFENVWKQYFSTVGSYPYAAVNAFNFWGFFGLNWASQENVFLGIPYKVYGTLFIIAAIAAVLFLSIRSRKDSEKYPFLGALMVISIFVFSVRMHERYMYPGLILLLLAYIYKPSRLNLLCYGGFSALHFYNTAWVLFYYDPTSYNSKAPLFVLVSFGMLIFSGILYYTAWQSYSGSNRSGQALKEDSWETIGSLTKEESPHLSLDALKSLSEKLAQRQDPTPRASCKGIPLNKWDFICIAVITLIYSCFALYDLGDMEAPETSLEMTHEQTIELDFGSKAPAKLSYYMAPWQDRTFSLEGKKESLSEWAEICDIELDNVFTWQTIDLAQTDMTKLRLTLKETQASLLELVFTDGEGNVLTPVNAQDYSALFDEASLYPEEKTFRNSMYFDEIYHGRTAYEFLNGLTSYENTHPPLGKFFISLGVAIFGMNPFGWRIIGTLFGICMVPIVYLFGKRLTENTPLAALSCILFTFDFMHFTQTRIATIDVYVTFFVILMYYFMYRYSKLSFYDTPLIRTLLPLGACGICMGLGVASKWTGAYAGVGLALIFFATLYRRYQEYCYAKATPSGRSNGISHKHIVKSFVPNAWRTVLFCVVFFVIIPVTIYLLSYIPFVDYSGRGLIQRALYNQTTMFNYHSNLDATHSFSSSWYQWPIIQRPIWYYSRIVTGVAGEGGLREGISSFGNPAVWWLGIPAAFYMVYLWAKNKDKTAAFLLVGYLAQYLPWFFVTRITFIYHYFPSVIFVVLMIVYALKHWKQRVSERTFRTTILVYGGVVIGLFLLFYPVLSGQAVDADFVDQFLRWFDSWVLVAS